MPNVISINHRRASGAEAAAKTRKIIARQDAVDNQIHELIENLTGKRIGWEIEIIGDVRDAIAAVLEDNGIIRAAEFYPALPEDDDDASGEELRSLADGWRALKRDFKERPLETGIEAAAVLIFFLLLFYGLPLLSNLIGK